MKVGDTVKYISTSSLSSIHGWTGRIERFDGTYAVVSFPKLAGSTLSLPIAGLKRVKKTVKNLPDRG